jgi:hypothetical protein
MLRFHVLALPCCALTLLLSLSACSLVGDEADDDPALPFRTDRTTYEAQLSGSEVVRVEFTIATAYTNVRHDTVYLLGCNRPSLPVLQKDTGDAWARAYSAPEDLCLSPPWRIAPGTTYRDTLHVHGYRSGGDPRFHTEVDGTYRLTRSIYADPDGATLLPAGQRTSNTFEVAVAAE